MLTKINLYLLSQGLWFWCSVVNKFHYYHLYVSLTKSDKGEETRVTGSTKKAAVGEIKEKSKQKWVRVRPTKPPVLPAAVLSKIFLIFSSCANLFSSAGKWDESAAIILIGCRRWRRAASSKPKRRSRSRASFSFLNFTPPPPHRVIVRDVEERSKQPSAFEDPWVCRAKMRLAPSVPGPWRLRLRAISGPAFAHLAREMKFLG